MALVSYVSNQDAAEKIRPIFEKMEGRGGQVPNFLRVLAHYPEMVEAFLALNATLPQDQARRQAPRAGLHQDLGAQRLRLLPAAPPAACGQKAGLNDRQLGETADFETSDAYDELQRDVLRYAEQVTRHINVDDALFDRSRTPSDRELVELAMTVGIANFTNRVTETLRMELP